VPPLDRRAFLAAAAAALTASLVTFEYPGQVPQYEMRIWSKPRLFDITAGAAVCGDKGYELLAV
jgi:hypothetical protein